MTNVSAPVGFTFNSVEPPLIELLIYKSKSESHVIACLPAYAG
jgi:hypothetical protein